MKKFVVNYTEWIFDLMKENNIIAYLSYVDAFKLHFNKE